MDLAKDLAHYQPLADMTGSAEIRILGDDMYVGTGGAWQHSTRQPDLPSWVEMMPMSGNPVMLLEHLVEADVESTATEVPEHDDMVCREYLETAAEGDPRLPSGDPSPYVGCHREGVLRWVRYSESDDGGPITLTFDDVDGEVVVDRPTEHVTPFGDETPRP